MSEKKIRVMKNGPYHVTGGIRLVRESLIKTMEGFYQWVDKEVVAENKKSYYLCRCGASKRMPYCDGSHHKIDFNGEEEASLDTFMERAYKREGDGIALYDDVDLCSLSRFCNTSFGKVWNAIKDKPLDEEKREAIIKGSIECPSGRLLAVDLLTGKAYEPIYDEVEISSTQDIEKEVSGPLVVRGEVLLESAEGAFYEKRNRVALCRCGKSQNKPFCDASHIPMKFIDEDLEQDILKAKDKN